MSLSPIITNADLAQALGAPEVKPCPFCGHWAFSAGELNSVSGNSVYHVTCSNAPSCGAQIHACDKDSTVARINVIEKWNKRTP